MDSGRSFPRAALSLARPGAGLRYNTSGECGAAFRLTLSAHAWSSQTAYERGSGEVAVELAQVLRIKGI